MKKLLILIFSGLLLSSLYYQAVTYAEENTSVYAGFDLLKSRKDTQALEVFERILADDPENVDALWGKAEIYRRTRNFDESEKLLNQILQKDADNASSLITLSYIKYKKEKFNDALRLINKALKSDNLNNENRAMCYMMMGTINSGRSTKGGLFSKLAYGTQIKNYFIKAKEINPKLPEVYLGLGCYYLLAPKVAGGNIERAIEELQCALQIAPEFCTACARLAQAYKKKGDLDKYNSYFKRAKELDPGNEVVKELENDKSGS